MTALVMPELARRVELERMLEASGRRQKAARHLWVDGQLAEAYALSASAFKQLAESLGQDAGAERDELDGALQRLAALPPPSLDSDYRAGHAAMLEQIWALDARLRRNLARTLGLASPQRRRIAIAAGVILTLCTILILKAERPELTARASASYTSDHPPRLTIDGLPGTEWLLPDGQTGWLELELTVPRHARELWLKNVHNRGYNDRATRAFEIDVYEGDTVRATVTGEFRRLDPNPEWHSVRLPPGRVSAVRIRVVSFFAAGGGLAEVEIH